MGFFSRKLRKRDSLESQLIDEYSMAFQSTGMRAREAKKVAGEMVAEARREVEQRGWSKQATSYGEALLEAERSDRPTQEKMEALRQDGVRDADIRWWWNMRPLERVMIEKSDELNRTSAFLACLQQGLDPDAAMKKIFQAHAKFGDPREGDGDDRPIPIELKGRIVDFVERQYADLESFRRKMESASSFNALVRTEIRAGML